MTNIDDHRTPHSIKLTYREWAQVKRRAAAEGMTAHAYMRSRVLAELNTDPVPEISRDAQVFLAQTILLNSRLVVEAIRAKSTGQDIIDKALKVTNQNLRAIGLPIISER